VPQDGKDGGTVVFEGTPKDLAKCEASATAASIAEKVLKVVKT
jgi:excinuclease UvrABC ATPase subunit